MLAMLKVSWGVNTNNNNNKVKAETVIVKEFDNTILLIVDVILSFGIFLFLDDSTKVKKLAFFKIGFIS